MNDLKPCPFCGSIDLVIDSTATAEIGGVGYQNCWIECFGCGASGPVIEVTDDVDNSNQIIADAWNKREI